MWSECSWVTRIAVSDSGAWPAKLRRSKVSLRERPASIKRRVRSVATSVELPALEDARTETFTMGRPPLESIFSVAENVAGERVV